MIIVDKENFEAEVQQSAMPCVVDLWGPQCGPCLALMPEVEKLAAEYDGKVQVLQAQRGGKPPPGHQPARHGRAHHPVLQGWGMRVARSGDAVSIEAIKAETDKLA
jgi:Thioredoxin domain-containing protein